MIHANRPAFLITVDTEGDNLWSQPGTITTENARFLPRFQALCEKYGFRPVWLTNYEMAQCPAFVEFARDVLRRGAGEVGMHLHAWNTPPETPLTDDDYRHQPYLYEYPEPVMRDKIRFLTDLLEERFERKMVSHRAGRWGLDAVYARLLADHGYRVDCSVTPYLSWAEYPGDPHGRGGPDFSGFPETPYYLDLDWIDRPGDSPLLEVPVSVAPSRGGQVGNLSYNKSSLFRRAYRRFFPPLWKMIPQDRRLSFRGMRKILDHALANRWPCVELATHSSELMPGGSPFFRSRAAIERLYGRLEILFSAAAKDYNGMTLEAFQRSRSGIPSSE
ncbi:MAG: hypothetical protein JXB10_08765 [Pirellulales bacterium]|nr:hypothetical protein [Pirellulales bacterium]